jgi:hypothetical protein
MISQINFKDIPLNDLTPSQFQATTTYRFPEDVGQLDKGHYMIFNIFVQKISKLAVPGKTREGDNDRARYIKQINGANAGNLGEVYSSAMNSGFANGFGKIGNSLTQMAVNGANKLSSGLGQSLETIVDVAKSGGDIISETMNMTNATFNNNVVQLKDNIAIYMPDTLNFNSNAGYDTASLSGDLLTLGGVGKSLYDNFDKNSQSSKTNVAAFILGELKNKFPVLNSATFNAAFVSKFGAKNPMVEVVYSKPELRSFRFDYMFYPRSQSEALEVQQIIQTFVYHQAPEIKDGTGGYYLVPPSTFDIGFFYRGQINPNIPKITTCVLRTVDVDYAPNGFHAFETEDQERATLGGTGMPVGIRLSLQFQETLYITKEYLDGEIKEKKQQQSQPPFVNAEGQNITVGGINGETGQPTAVTNSGAGTITGANGITNNPLRAVPQAWSIDSNQYINNYSTTRYDPVRSAIDAANAKLRGVNYTSPSLKQR